MNKLQRIEDKHVRGLRRLGSTMKRSALRRCVRTSLEYESCKEKQKIRNRNTTKDIVRTSL